MDCSLAIFPIHATMEQEIFLHTKQEFLQQDIVAAVPDGECERPGLQTWILTLG